MMTNHIEDFRYKMERECQQQECCGLCPYHYKQPFHIIGNDAILIDRCFKDDLINYISYQAGTPI